MRTARITMEATLEVDGGYSLALAADVLAHMVKDSPQWGNTFALCPDGDARPCRLIVTKVQELDEEGLPVDCGEDEERAGLGEQ